MAERTCSKCGVTKPETLEFFRSRGTKDRGGLRPDCRDCSAARDRAYYEAHREGRLRVYRQANAARIAAYQAEYMKNYTKPPVDPERLRRWKDAGGREIYARAAQRRRARKAALAADLTALDWNAALAWFDNRCAYCGNVEVPLTQDHVVPVSRGGPYVSSNIVPACSSCNSRKHNSEMERWFRKQGYFSEKRLQSILFYQVEVTAYD